MKKLYLIPIVFLFMTIFQSCSKQSANELIAPASPNPNVISATIAPNQSYVFNVNSSIDVSIERQASHYRISKAGPDSKSGLVVYEYLPAQDFTGKDEVVLSSKIAVYSYDNRGGCNSSHVNDNSVATSFTTTYTTIRFTVAN